MSTTTDLNISSLSYTAKDFGSIYPELIELASQLTNKWDPSQSNESDPGVVLLKEAAFVADHNNYNIDKNILENFLPSATQDRSVRNITEMNGYTPRYYISATGSISVKWTCPEESKSDDTINHAFTIPAFTLCVSDADNTVTYTQIEDLTVIGDGQTSSCTFIEGTLQTLSINDSDTITYSNLDTNNRIYLPETMVAQNGIYIKNVNSNDYASFWTRDNYLLTRANGSRIYKIDYDSVKGLPYIEFPSDIANIIGDGLKIQYFATSGANGNVAAKTLATIISPSEFTANNENFTRSCSDFTITNYSSISNGKDPETINEMYKSFKKIVGTFDTLVSCKDYTNAVNTLEDSNFNKLVSNCYVTDRRTDYNKAVQVITYDEYKELFKIISIEDARLSFVGYGSSLPTSASAGDLFCQTGSGSYTLKYYNGASWVSTANNTINLNDFAELTAAMTPYDLAVYALSAFSMNDYSTSNKSAALDNSFKPVSGTTLRSIKNKLENNKCISHTYNDPSSNEIFCFKNYVPLNIIIHPFNKVSLVERNEIIDNVWRALCKNFNASELEFGSELDFDSVKKVIIDADSRINTAELGPFNYTMKAMTGDGELHDPYTAPLPTSRGQYKIIVDLVAKNILAGRVCLFNLDTDFSYKYGQVINGQGGIFRNVTKISSEFNVPLDNTQVTSVITETVATQRNFVNTETNQAAYYFNAPNKNSSSDRQPLKYNETYTLTGEDTFFWSYVENGKTISAAYKSHDNLSYTIKNLSRSDFVNSSDTTPKTLPTSMTSGTVIVIENAAHYSDTTNVVNLNNLTLKENERFQIISPNYYSTVSYGAYVNYRYEGKNTIPANVEYTLGSNETIVLLYTTTDSASGTSIQQSAQLSAGDIIKTNFAITPTSSAGSTYTTGTTKTWTDNLGNTHTGIFDSMSSSQSIDKREVMKTVLDSQVVMCYWMIDSAVTGDNRLFDPGESEKILEAGDYFIYANSTLDEMVILGSGTKLVRTDVDDSKWLISKDPLAIDIITEQGKDAIIDWQTMDFSENNFEIQEMSIIVLGQDDIVRITGWDSCPETKDGKAPSNLDNTWYTCNGNITYTSGGTTTSLPRVNNFYKIRTRLDLSMSSSSYQELQANESITLTYADGNVTLNTTGLRLQSNGELNLIGGKEISTSGLNLFGLNLNIYAYQTENITVTMGGNTENIFAGDSGYTISLNDKSGSARFPFMVSPIYERGDTTKRRLYVLPVYIAGSDVPVIAQVKQDGSVINIREFNAGSSWTTSLSMTGTNMFYIEVYTDNYTSDTKLELILSWNISKALSESETIIVNEFFTIISDEGNIINTNLAKCSVVTSDAVCGRIREIITYSDNPSVKPYYTYTPDNSMVLEQQNFSEANVLWDQNNIANMMTIPQIDYQNSSVDIATSLRNY